MRASFLLLLPAIAVAQDDFFFNTATGLFANLPDANIENGNSRTPPTGTEEDLSNLLITGWHSDCNRQYECLGDYRPNTGTPAPIDVTGNTCYMNPAKEKKDAVIWYAKLPYAGGTPLEDEVFAWTITLHEPAATDVMPGPCDDNGACDCGAFEAVRAGWNNITSSSDYDDLCSWPATACGFYHTRVYSPVECNVNFWVEVTTGGVLSRTCMTAASLELASTPVPAPTSTPSTVLPSTLAPTGTATTVLPQPTLAPTVPGTTANTEPTTSPTTSGPTVAPQPTASPTTTGPTVAPQPTTSPTIIGPTVASQPTTSPTTTGTTVAPQSTTSPTTTGTTVAPQPTTSPTTTGTTVAPQPTTSPTTTATTVAPQPTTSPTTTATTVASQPTMSPSTFATTSPTATLTTAAPQPSASASPSSISGPTSGPNASESPTTGPTDSQSPSSALTSPESGVPATKEAFRKVLFSIVAAVVFAL